jgi:hypothetical protein
MIPALGFIVSLYVSMRMFENTISHANMVLRIVSCIFLLMVLCVMPTFFGHVNMSGITQ